MLLLGRGQVTLVSRLIALGGEGFEDEGEGGAGAGRGEVGVGAVDGEAVVGDGVAGGEESGAFAGEVVGGVVGEALGEAEDFGFGVGADAAVVGADDVAEAAVLGIDAFEGEPDGEDAGGREAEIEIVLMRRGDVVRAGRLVEPLGLVGCGRFAQERFGQLGPAAISLVLGEERVAVETLELLERFGPVAIFVESVCRGERGNDVADVAVEVGL